MSEFTTTPYDQSAIETHSDLTELPNRRMLEQTLEQLIDSGETNISLLSLDLDDLKRINDSFGHLEGDAYIINAAQSIEASIRAGDDDSEGGDMLVPSVAELYHRSGDEFYVIIRNTTNTQAIVERIQQNLDDIESRASIGFAVYEPNDTVSSFQSRSEAALIEDKRRRRYATFSPEQHEALQVADVQLAMHGLRVTRIDKTTAVS